VHIYILDPNYCGGIFFKSLSYLYEVVRINYSADFFWTFHNFDRNFSKMVASPSNENKNCLAVLKGQSFLKKGENGMKIDP